MVAQNVKTQIFDIVSTTKTDKVSGQKQKSKSMDFDSVMNSNMKPKNADTSKTKENKEITQKNLDLNKQVEPDTKQVNASETDGVIKNVSMDEVAQSVDTEDLINFKDIENLINALQNAIQSNLEISEEELEKAMETLGLTVMDLLNMDNLKQLLMQVKGTKDVSEFLTNEELGNSLKQLMEAVETTIQEYPVSKEEIQNFLDLEQSKNMSLPQAETKTVIESEESVISTTSDNHSGEISLEVYKSGDEKASDNNQSNSSKDNTDVNNSNSVDTFIQNLTAGLKDENINFTQQLDDVRQMQDITNQIVERIKIFIKPDQTSMDLQLNPESLGKINLSVISKDGIMTAQFTTQNQFAKEAIESQMQVLRDNLNNQGLKVEAIEVTVSDFAFAQSDQASGDTGKGQKNHSRNQGSMIEDTDSYVDSNENASTDILEQSSGSSIDYTA